jgi:hypothetical protein
MPDVEEPRKVSAPSAAQFFGVTLSGGVRQ